MLCTGTGVIIQEAHFPALHGRLLAILFLASSSYFFSCVLFNIASNLSSSEFDTQAKAAGATAGRNGNNGCKKMGRQLARANTKEPNTSQRGALLGVNSEVGRSSLLLPADRAG